MFPDLTGLPLLGGASLGGAAYVAMSLLVAGPLVAERTIEKSDWPTMCARRAQAVQAQPSAAPSLNCGSVLGAIYGGDGEAFCRRYGPSVDMLLGGPLGAVRRRAEDEARHAGSACACAVTLVMEQHRLDFALHAGTARLVTPASIRGLRGELDRALASSPCRSGA